MTLRRDSPRPLSGAIGVLQRGWAPPTLIGEIQQVWPDVVGGQLAAVATPTSEHVGVLTVSCSDAGWANELDLMSTTLLERLNGRLQRGSVRRLRCVIGA
jgi:predicted nucleic acid-binding Zn ribbon protein